MNAVIHHGDCLEILRGIADASVDAIVTDPPYGLSFMGKKWDYDVPSADIWRECLRVLKPGGHLLAFAGTRTQHRMAVNIEDAGFEIRDLIAWVYGSGFPKSLDVSKAIDKAVGAQREVVGRNKFAALNGKANVNTYGTATRPDETAPATDAAKQWEGWGTALKPALEPITVARKPLIGTVAENVLANATGAINIAACRVGDEVKGWTGAANNVFAVSGCGKEQPQYVVTGEPRPVSGRWPANLIHDGSDEVVGLFPVTAPSSVRPPTGKPLFATSGRAVEWNANSVKDTTVRGISDAGGSAARFFYCAKASKADRDEGCSGLIKRGGHLASRDGGGGGWQSDAAKNPNFPRHNHHPTVKPTALMRYLCRLVTPPRGTVLDPFMGSGSTGKAAVLEGFQFIGIEREAEYVEIAKARIVKADTTASA